MTTETRSPTPETAAARLAAVARATAATTEARGGPYLAHLLGLHTVGRRAIGRRTLRIAPPRPLRPEPSILTLVAIADIACGAALASHYAWGARMATLSLTIHLAGSAAMAAPAVSATARSISVAAAEAAAAVTAFDAAGNPLAFGQTSFLHLPPPADAVLRPPPWDRPPTGRRVAADEAALPAWADSAASRIVEAASRALPGSFWDGFAAPDPASWTAAGNGRFQATLPNGMEKRNRVGHTQGGIVFAGMAIAANWALRGRPGPGWTLLNGHVRFLRPGRAASLPIDCEVLRTGGSVSDVLVRLGEPGREVAIGLFVLEPQTQRQDAANRETEEPTE